MWAKALLAATLVLAPGAYAFTTPPDGTEPIPTLMSESTLVCKGEVVEAPPIKVAVEPRRFTGTATVRLDRCFKGSPQSTDIAVLFDDVLPKSGGLAVVLKTGDYFLFFLKQQGDKFIPTDQFFSTLTISRLTASPAANIIDPMTLLELDLKAGLDDPDGDRVLDSIRMLGNMRHLQSKKELLALSDSPDDLIRAHAYEALLRLGDYSILKGVGHFFASQPQAPKQLFLPRDRLLLMQFRLATQISLIRDVAVLPQLEQFMLSANSILRSDALQAVRSINCPQSAPYFLKLLDDPDPDNRFGAMQGLLSIARPTDTAWVPTWLEFRKAPDFYAAKTREWWEATRQHAASGERP